MNGLDADSPMEGCFAAGMMPYPTTHRENMGGRLRDGAVVACGGMDPFNK